MSTPLPEYVEYGPRETAPPPFTAGKGAFAGLILKGKSNAIEALCDKVLNNPFEQPGPPCWQLGPFGFGRRPASPWVFKPFSDAVLLFAGRWEGLVSTTRVGMGSANEDQVSLWVPVKARNESTGEEKLLHDGPLHVRRQPDVAFERSRGLRLPEVSREVPAESPESAEGAASVWAFGGEFGPGQTAECRRSHEGRTVSGVRCRRRGSAAGRSPASPRAKTRSRWRY